MKIRLNWLLFFALILLLGSVGRGQNLLQTFSVPQGNKLGSSIDVSEQGDFFAVSGYLEKKNLAFVDVYKLVGDTVWVKHGPRISIEDILYMPIHDYFGHFFKVSIANDGRTVAFNYFRQKAEPKLENERLATFEVFELNPSNDIWETTFHLSRTIGPVIDDDRIAESMGDFLDFDLSPDSKWLSMSYSGLLGVSKVDFYIREGQNFSYHSSISGLGGGKTGLGIEFYNNSKSVAITSSGALSVFQLSANSDWVKKGSTPLSVRKRLHDYNSIFVSDNSKYFSVSAPANLIQFTEDGAEKQFINVWQYFTDVSFDEDFKWMVIAHSGAESGKGYVEYRNMNGSPRTNPHRTIWKIVGDKSNQGLGYSFKVRNDMVFIGSWDSNKFDIYTLK